jgi:hypothetical protein
MSNIDLIHGFISADGDVSYTGLAGSRRNASLAGLGRGHIAIRHKGERGWQGRGQSGYDKGFISVHRLTSLTPKEGGGSYFVAVRREVIEMPLTATDGRSQVSKIALVADNLQQQDEDMPNEEAKT